MELLRNSLLFKLIYEIFKILTSLFKLFAFFAPNKVQYKKCDIQRTKDLNTEIGTFRIFPSNQKTIFLIRVKHTKNTILIQPCAFKNSLNVTGILGRRGARNRNQNFERKHVHLFINIWQTSFLQTDSLHKFFYMILQDGLAYKIK